MSDPIILIADDDDNDVLLLRIALEAAGIRNNTRVVSNGEDVICYLKGEGEFADRAKYPFPILLILNLQMPRKSGGEVLTWMNAQREMPSLKLLVLTGTLDPRQARDAAQLGAEAFLPKPPEPKRLLELLKEMDGVTLVCSDKGYKLQLSTAG